MNSSTNTNPNTGSSTDKQVMGFKNKNSAFIKEWKKKNGVKTQTVMPTLVSVQNEWAIKNGFSITDAQQWRALCEKAKYCTEDAFAQGVIDLLTNTLEMASHVEAHPIGLINFARTAMGQKVWNKHAYDHLKANMLPTLDLTEEGEEEADDEDGEDDEDSYEEPGEDGEDADGDDIEVNLDKYVPHPDSAEAYLIDDDAPADGTSKKKRKMGDEDLNQ